MPNADYGIYLNIQWVEIIMFLNVEFEMNLNKSKKDILTKIQKHIYLYPIYSGVLE